MEIVKTLGNARLLKHKPTETEMEDYTEKGSYAVKFGVSEFEFNRDERAWKSTKPLDYEYLVYVLYKNSKTGTLDVYLDREEDLKNFKKKKRFYFVLSEFMVRSFEGRVDYEITNDRLGSVVRDAYLLALEDIDKRLEFEME